MLSNNLTLLTSTISTMSITKGAFAMVLKNSNFRISSKTISNSQLRNDSTSISSSTKDSPSKVTSVEETSTIEGRSLTFIIIQIGGADRVRKVEDWFTETFGNWIVLRKDPNTNAPKTNNTEHDSDKYVVNGNGNRSSKTPSWASTLVIAYGIHKLLVPFRLGLTAAVTPPIVKKLRRMGWNIGGKHM
ncbi:peptide alpha-N-acetyltransferase [Rhizophagus clarus]|uniref:Peptide alpha-N-acetyltransferase n=1 Tax=Rhizophagus clarus TaxID=94130 RepID=A0A8H3LI73_9GLOM|nr:peptide alpha-N-acetyltransferase [Rhizophagus clarus]